MNAKKSKKANLERLRFPLLLIGLTFSGAIVLSAFEWRSYDEMSTIQVLPELMTLSSLPDEQIFIAIPERKPVVKKKRVVQTPVIDIFKIVKNEAKIDIVLVVPEPGVVEPIVQEIGFVPEVIVEDKVWEIPEVMPSFPGGLEALYEFLGSEIQYPDLAKDAGVQGRVYVGFIVGKDGELRDIKILRGIGAGCDKEALRVLGRMPNWTPGKQGGMTVDVQYSIPINYVLN